MKKTTPTKLKPPKGLSYTARCWWNRLQTGYAITDDGGVAILNEGAWSVERAEQARAAIERDGLVLYDRFGQARPHPAVAIERDARAAVLRALKALRIEQPESLHAAPGRPANYKGGISHANQ